MVPQKWIIPEGMWPIVLKQFAWQLVDIKTGEKIWLKRIVHPKKKILFIQNILQNTFFCAQHKKNKNKFRFKTND